VAALSAAEPSVAEAVASEFTQNFCGDSPPKGDQRVMFALLAQGAPTLLSGYAHVDRDRRPQHCTRDGECH